MALVVLDVSRRRHRRLCYLLQRAREPALPAHLIGTLRHRRRSASTDQGQGQISSSYAATKQQGKVILQFRTTIASRWVRLPGRDDQAIMVTFQAIPCSLHTHSGSTATAAESSANMLVRRMCTFRCQKVLLHHNGLRLSPESTCASTMRCTVLMDRSGAFGRSGLASFACSRQRSSFSDTDVSVTVGVRYTDHETYTSEKNASPTDNLNHRVQRP